MENTIIIDSNKSCETCGLYNTCTYKNQSTTRPCYCTRWVKIPNTIDYIKTDGTQIHQCPSCGHKWWE